MWLDAVNKKNERPNIQLSYSSLVVLFVGYRRSIVVYGKLCGMTVYQYQLWDSGLLASRGAFIAFVCGLRSHCLQEKSTDPPFLAKVKANVQVLQIPSVPTTTTTTVAYYRKLQPTVMSHVQELNRIPESPEAQTVLHSILYFV